jgi:hypothetical protein
VDVVQRDGDGITFETTSAKPHWSIHIPCFVQSHYLHGIHRDTGAAMSLSLKKQSKTGDSTSNQPQQPKVWTISADDGDELMDEDALLAPSDLQVHFIMHQTASPPLNLLRLPLPEFGFAPHRSRSLALLPPPRATASYRRGARLAKIAPAAALRQRMRTATTPHRRPPPLHRPVAA